jgi:hypothetical protein
MNPGDVAQRIGDRLEEAGIEYAIGGALALGTWGAPRTTKDVDLSIFASVADFPAVTDALERAGMMLDRERAPKDIERIGMFSGRLAGLVVDMFMSAHPHMLEMQRRRQRVDASDGTHLYFISPEDLCVMKLVYGRPKDVVDLERLFAARALDVAYIRGWLAKMPVGPDRGAILDDLVRRFG